MSAKPSSSLVSVGSRNDQQPPSQQQQQQQQPAAGTAVYNPSELHGVPIAYRQEDGSEMPAPVIDASHRRAYYPSPESSTGRRLDGSSESQPSRESSSYASSLPPPPTAATAPATRANSLRSGGPPSATRQTSFNASAVSSDARDGTDEAQRYRREASDIAAAAASATPVSMKTHSENPKNSAGVTYDAVVKPVFSPFQELRARQQQQQQHLQAQPQYQLEPQLPTLQQLYQQQHQQQPDSANYARQNDEGSPSASHSYPSHPTYVLSYAQPQYSQPSSAHNVGLPPDPSYMSSIVVPNTAGASSAMLQSQLYAQQPQQQYEMFHPEAAAAAATDVQPLNEPPYWNTGLFGLALDPLSTIDSFVCYYCISSAHFNVIYREEQGIYAPMMAGLCCVDFCCSTSTFPYLYPVWAVAIHTFVIRRELRKRYGIKGNPFLVKHSSGDDGGRPTLAQEVTVEGNSGNLNNDSREAQPRDAAGDSQPREGAATTAQTVMESPVKQRPAANTSTEAAPSTTSANDGDAAVSATAATWETNTAVLPPMTEVVVVTPARHSFLDSLKSINWLELGADGLIALCCIPCAMAQHHREMSLRGEWPGKVVFSRECFCGAREQVESAVPVTHMF